MARITSPWLLTATILTLSSMRGYAMPLLIENMVSRATSSLEKMHIRSANTCADPSLAKPVYLAFTGPSVAHVLGFRWLLANEDSKVGSAYWNFQGELFRGWQSQQPFTVPLFTMLRPNELDYVSVLGVDAATPPALDGFVSGGIAAWVYNSPACGESVPLYGLANSVLSDHFYTVDASDRDVLEQNGWTDEGIVAYVLPL